MTRYKLFALFLLLSGCDQCGEAKFCHRYCEEKFGPQVVVYRGLYITTDSKYCDCEVGVLLPVQLKVEQSDPNAKPPN